MKPRKARSLFITGTDTDVGKTYAGCLIAKNALASGIQVGAYKPVASGFETIEGSDGQKLWEATGNQGELNSVSPQRFAAPFAPSVAAAAEGRVVDEDLLFAGFEKRSSECDLLIVEGAGGLFSPVSNRYSNADLILRMNATAILVANWKLGVVHQVLCALHAAAHCQIRIAMIVLSEPNPQLEATKQSHLELLRKTLSGNQEWNRLPIRGVSYGETAWSPSERWLELAGG